MTNFGRLVYNEKQIFEDGYFLSCSNVHYHFAALEDKHRLKHVTLTFQLLLQTNKQKSDIWFSSNVRDNKKKPLVEVKLNEKNLSQYI